MTLDEFLTDAATRRPGSEVKLSIRDLLSHWGFRRRDPEAVRSIESDLLVHGLITRPSFESTWIDNDVELVKAPTQDTTVDDEAVPLTVLASGQDTSLRVSSLQSANAGVVRVRPDDKVVKARSLMHRYDYSQLPVMKGERALLGVISWESIAKGRLDGEVDTVQTVVDRASTVDLDADLLGAIPQIIDAGYVFVEDATKRVTGIVTTTDLSMQFQSLAGPFLLVGEAERRLRRLADRWFGLDLIKSSVHDSPERQRRVSGAADLTIGEIQRLFQPEERWAKYDAHADRKIFLEALEEMRKLRNEIMHFNPDPLDPSAVAGTRQFLKWLEYLDIVTDG